MFSFFFIYIYIYVYMYIYIYIHGIMVSLIGHSEPKQTKNKQINFALRLVLNIEADTLQTSFSKQIKMDFFFLYFQSSIPLKREKKKKEGKKSPPLLTKRKKKWY